MKTDKILLLTFLFFIFTLPMMASTNPKWITEITIDPVQPYIGQQVNFSAVLKVEQGPVDNLVVKVKVDSTRIFRHVYPHLDRDAEVTVNAVWPAQTGNHRVQFIIDPQSTSGDINTSDNLKERNFTVLEPLAPLRPGTIGRGGMLNRPDLWVYWNLPNHFAPNTYHIAVFRIGIKNIGPGGSTACNLSISISKQNLKIRSINFPVPALKPNSGEIFSFQAEFQSAGDYLLVAHVNVSQMASELNRENNSLFKNFKVVDNVKPDLVISDLVCFQQINIGKTAKVWGKVKNIGNATSVKSTLKIICSPKKKTRTKTIPALRPGQEVPFEFGFEYWTTGPKRCGLWIDLGNKVDELNEDNNFRTIGFKVITSTIFD